MNNNYNNYIPNNYVNNYPANPYQSYYYQTDNYHTDQYSQTCNYYESQLSYMFNKVRLLENENAYLKRCKKRLEKKESTVNQANPLNTLSFEIVRNPFSPNAQNESKDSKSEKLCEKPDSNNKLKNKKICYTPNKESYDKDKVTSIIKNLKSIDDIINLPEDKYIRHNKYLNKVLKIRESLISLNNLIGLDNIKKEIFKHVIYFIMNDNEIKENNRLHTVIQGPPGVGKTELGKILSKIYLEIGILENDKINIVKRSDLIGGYLGQTAIKTQEAIDEAMGGVLFIDEAYSLGDKDNKDSYSKECLDTLNMNLTENGNKFICIIAGYEEDLEKCFFSTNSGLERRFNFRYTIDKYSDDEMVQIFKYKALHENWDLQVTDEELKEFFENNEFPYYGGDIERLIFQSQLTASLRTFNKQEYHIDRYLTLDDMNSAIDIIKKKEEEELNDWQNNYM